MIDRNAECCCIQLGPDCISDFGVVSVKKMKAFATPFELLIKENEMAKFCFT